MASALLDAIPDILLEYAQHWNLFDLCALLQTNKTIAAMLNDFKIVSIIIENYNRELFLKKADERILKFLSYKAKMAAKQNDAEAINFVLEQYSRYFKNHTLHYLAPMVLPAIFQYDADLALESIWNHYSISKSASETDSDLLPLLAKFTIHPCYVLGSNVTFSKISKTFEFVLRKCSVHLDDIIANIVLDATSGREHQRRNAPIDNITLFRAVMHCRKIFPEYFSFDINKRMDAVQNVSPLEKAAQLHNRELFELFLEHGAMIDNENACYCKLAYDNFNKGVGPFVQYMIKRGVDVNAEYNEHSLLYFYVSQYDEPDDVYSQNIPTEAYIIEDLLYNGAKLKEEEEDIFLQYKRYTHEHKLWYCLATMDLPYTLEARAMSFSGDKMTKFIEENTRITRLTFKPFHDSSGNIIIHSNGKAEQLNSDPPLSGTWQFLFLSDMLEVHLEAPANHEGYTVNNSYQEYSVDRLFKLVQLFNEHFALLPLEVYWSRKPFDVTELYMPDATDFRRLAWYKLS